jgi:hypothetical protein
VWAERTVVECSRVWEWERGSSVGIVTALQPERSVFPSPTWCKKRRFLRCIQTDSGTHLLSYCFPRSTAWSWPLNNIQCQGEEWEEFYLLSCYIFSWRGCWQIYPLCSWLLIKRVVNVVLTVLSNGTYSNHCALDGIWLWFWLVSSLFRCSPGGSTRSDKPRHSQVLWASFWTLEW